MTQQVGPARPADTEAAAYYHGYIASVPEGDVLDLLERQAAEIDALFSPIAETAALHRYAPGKWSIKEVLGHLVDAERVFAHRMFRFGRGDETPLPGFDENTYVAAGNFDQQTLEALRREFATARAATVALARGMSPSAWTRAGTANGKAITARAILYVIVGHVAHHARVLRERYGMG